LFSTSATVNPSQPPPRDVPRCAAGVPPVADGAREVDRRPAVWKQLAWGPSSWIGQRSLKQPLCSATTTHRALSQSRSFASRVHTNGSINSHGNA
jgi:hypothetical protein